MIQFCFRLNKNEKVNQLYVEWTYYQLTAGSTGLYLLAAFYFLGSNHSY